MKAPRFSFILIALVTEKMEKGKKLSINIYINNEKDDIPIDCILENSVDPKSEQTQANFLCSVDKNKNDYSHSPSCFSLFFIVVSLDT